MIVRGFEPTSLAGVEGVVSWNSLDLSHHPTGGQQLSVPVDVIHGVLEGNLLHTVRLFKQTAYKNVHLIHFCIELFSDQAVMDYN